MGNMNTGTSITHEYTTDNSKNYLTLSFKIDVTNITSCEILTKEQLLAYNNLLNYKIQLDSNQLFTQIKDSINYDNKFKHIIGELNQTIDDCVINEIVLSDDGINNKSTNNVIVTENPLLKLKLF